MGNGDFVIRNIPEPKSGGEVYQMIFLIIYSFANGMEMTFGTDEVMRINLRSIGGS